MAGELQPLDQKFPIVDANGQPTDYFTRWAQQRQIDIGDSLTVALLEDYLDAHLLHAAAGSGIGLAPDGNLKNSPTITAKVQEILDQISAVRGTVLYRAAAGWAALAPGPAGQFLQTAGAGADPLWAAGGGGVATPVPWNLSNRALTVPVGLTVVTSGGGSVVYSTKGATLIQAPAQNIYGVLAAPSSVSLTVEALIQHNPYSVNTASEIGVCFVDSTGKIAWMGSINTAAATFAWQRENWTNISTFSAATAGVARIVSFGPIWLKAVVAAGNITASYSFDGVNYIPFLPAFVATSFLGATLSFAGVWMRAGNNVYALAGTYDTANILHLAVTTP